MERYCCISSARVSAGEFMFTACLLVIVALLDKIYERRVGLL